MDAMTDETRRATAESSEDRPTPRFVVVGPDEVSVTDRTDDASDDADAASAAPGSPDAPEADPRDLLDAPAKVMRIGTMIKQLLDEVRSAPLDEAARSRLAQVHARSLRELEDGLTPDLVAELHRLTLPLGENPVPSDAELRIAQAQLVGWLEGLFHGIQTTLVAQQLAAQSQLAQIRRALPSGPQAPTRDGTGQYL